MKKKTIKCVVSLLSIVMFCTTIYAATILFAYKSETSNFTKKKIFEFNLNSGLNSTEIGPGDSCLISPCIYNSSTEEMYVFIKFKMPTFNDEFLYSFEVNDNWSLVKEENDGLVYAYGTEELIKLFPGEETESLTNQITFANLTNAEFYEIDEINIPIDWYAIEVSRRIMMARLWQSEI